MHLAILASLLLLSPSAEATQAAQSDAQSEIRRKQLNADIRAHEQRNNQLNDGKASDPLWQRSCY